MDTDPPSARKLADRLDDHDNAINRLVTDFAEISAALKADAVWKANFSSTFAQADERLKGVLEVLRRENMGSLDLIRATAAVQEKRLEKLENRADTTGVHALAEARTEIATLKGRGTSVALAFLSALLTIACAAVVWLLTHKSG